VGEKVYPLKKTENSHLRFARGARYIILGGALGRAKVGNRRGVEGKGEFLIVCKTRWGRLGR